MSDGDCTDILPGCEQRFRYISSTLDAVHTAVAGNGHPDRGIASRLTAVEVRVENVQSAIKGMRDDLHEAVLELRAADLQQDSRTEQRRTWGWNWINTAAVWAGVIIALLVALFK